MIVCNWLCYSNERRYANDEMMRMKRFCVTAPEKLTKGRFFLGFFFSLPLFSVYVFIVVVFWLKITRSLTGSVLRLQVFTTLLLNQSCALCMRAATLKDTSTGEKRFVMQPGRSSGVHFMHR